MTLRLQRFEVLDALRILLALDVAIGHVGMFPLFGPVDQSNALLALVARGVRTLVFGPPAVIAFFLISGFCIHYPFATTKSRCPLWRFYARRYLRILIPVVCAVALFKLLVPNTTIIGRNAIWWHSTLWSIVCEEIYYALYPFLNRLFPRFGWPSVLAVAFMMAIVVLWEGFPAVDWNDIGILATTLTLFPVWLLGCLLAEQVGTLEGAYSRRQMWLWRLAAWAVLWTAVVLHFHTLFHQTFTGIFVGVFCYFWIRAEIGYHKDRAPWPWLVRAGAWSYSLYLIHPIVAGVFYDRYRSMFESRIGWIVVISAVLLSAYVFYLLVERPSHNLARRVPLMSTLPMQEGPVLGPVNL